MQNNEGTLSNGMTVVALVNGMIGGIILVMPILALKVGYLMIAPVVMASGFVSYYSCLLCIRHLRNYKDLD
jgi:amino acid permease